MRSSTLIVTFYQPAVLESRIRTDDDVEGTDLEDPKRAISRRSTSTQANKVQKPNIGLNNGILVK